jgi:carboxypeptidase T
MFKNTIEIQSSLFAFASNYPQLTELISLPYLTSDEQKVVYGIKIGNKTKIKKPCSILFTGNVHAREWGVADICINLIADLLFSYTHGVSITYKNKEYFSNEIKSLLDSTYIYLIPCVNLDGLKYSQQIERYWRKNRNSAYNEGDETKTGVDLNRNQDILWDFPTKFSNMSPIRSSTNKSSPTYIGPAPTSENETKNIVWILDTYPDIKYYIDIHSHGGLILFPWGQDENQTENSDMNFLNPIYDGKRGVVGDNQYKEYINSEDLETLIDLGNKLNQGIVAVSGGSGYQVQQGVGLYPTSGTNDDYAFSRNYVNKNIQKVLSFTLEIDTRENAFNPSYLLLESDIMPEVCSGLISFCNAVKNNYCKSFDVKLPKSVVDILFGVTEDGGGYVIIGGKLVKIPPRSPLIELFSQLNNNLINDDKSLLQSLKNSLK